MARRARHDPTLVDVGRLVLGSASPRRAQLLTSAGLEFDVFPADIDESAEPGEPPADYVARLSIEKAATIAAECPGAIIVGADTTVDVDGQILEKPVDDDDLRYMLGLLSGRTHQVHTGVTVSRPLGDGCRGVETVVVTTDVTFAELTARDVDWYVATGDGCGKAGGYGIQGAAGAFVERVDGSVTNVIGLPLAETLGLIRRAADG